jgi:hypothetical protein
MKLYVLEKYEIKLLVSQFCLEIMKYCTAGIIFNSVYLKIKYLFENRAIIKVL